MLVYNETVNAVDDKLSCERRGANDVTANDVICLFKGDEREWKAVICDLSIKMEFQVHNKPIVFCMYVHKSFRNECNKRDI
jgi:hypothetical protein